MGCKDALPWLVVSLVLFYWSFLSFDASQKADSGGSSKPPVEMDKPPPEPASASSRALLLFTEPIEVITKAMRDVHNRMAEIYGADSCPLGFSPEAVRDLPDGNEGDPGCAIHLDEGDYKEAVECYKGEFEFRENVIGEEHPDCAFTMEQLGLSYHGMADLKSASHWMRRAMDSRSKNEGHTMKAARVTLRMAKLSAKSGDFQEALELDSSAVKIIEELKGDKHTAYADACLVWAQHLEVTGDPANQKQAHDLFVSSLAILKLTLPDEDSAVTAATAGVARTQPKDEL